VATDIRIEAMTPADWTDVRRILAAASLALHERAGFREVGIQRRLGRDREGRWRDRVLLERRSPTIGS
jgi:L-amino acid N-acyltransferase YncA